MEYDLTMHGLRESRGLTGLSTCIVLEEEKKEQARSAFDQVERLQQEVRRSLRVFLNKH